MITMVTPKKSKMVELGEVLRYHREQAGHSERSVCDLAGCSPKEYAAFEAGTDVPDNRRWSRMCMMNRQLQRYRPLWTEALHEMRTKASSPLTTKLADKLAGVQLPIATMTPPPMVQAPPDERPTLEERLAERDAQKQVARVVEHEVAEVAKEAERNPAFTVRNLPAGWRNSENVQEREAYAREVFAKDTSLSALAVAGMQKEKFGVATHRARLAEIRTEVATQMQRAAKAAKRDSKPDTAPTQAPAPKAPTVEESVAAATELLMEAIPNLASFSLSVNEEGQATVAYKTREVKVVETSGTITVGVRK